MLILSIVCLAAIKPAVTGQDIDTTNITLQSCTEEGALNDTVYVGWPYQFSCKNLVYGFGGGLLRSEKGLYDQYNGTCILRDPVSGRTNWTKTVVATNWYYNRFTNVYYNTPDVSESDPSRYQLIFQMPAANYCSYEDVYLSHRKVPEDMTCENFTRDEAPQSLLRQVVGRTMTFHCTDNDKKYKTYFQESHARNLTYEWVHNCSREIPNDHRKEGEKLIIHKVGYENAGMYTCIISYKGQRRYVINKNLCIKRRVSSTRTMSMKCPKVVTANAGDDVNLSCTLDLGIGKKQPLFRSVNWYKLLSNGEANGTFCRNLAVASEDTSEEEPRAGCTVRSRLTEDRCFSYVPPLEEQNPEPDETVLTLQIRNFQASDTGVYQVLFAMFSNTRSDNVTLALNRVPHLRKNTLAVAVAISFLLLLVILLVLCLWRKYDVLWFFKKTCGPYEKDDRVFSVYLAYYYSNESDTMSSKSRQLTVSLVDSLYEMFEQLGAPVYDEHRHGMQQHSFEIDAIAQQQKNCHRVVVILNPEYIADHWSIHKTYRALHDMIESGTKLIFITIPGVEGCLKELPNESKTALKHAMKLNTTIPWSGTTPLGGSFRRRLEYALPKLPPVKERNPSDKILLQHCS